MIYLDNSSSTKPLKEVIELVASSMEKDFFNPSSVHGGGLGVGNKIKHAKETFLNLLGCEGDIYFTSGGTESNNLAIIGSLATKKHIITTRSEHPSVIKVIEQQKNKGYKIDYIATDKYGTVLLSGLEGLLTKETGLVSIMDTNNELGTTQNLDLIGRTIKANSNAVFHVDAVASFCKKPISMQYVDLLSISSHKIHGPQGIGALFAKPDIRIKPLFFGGAQQQKIRPGTEYTAGILGFATAAAIAYLDMEKNLAHIQELNKIITELPIENMVVNSPKNSLPYILNVSFKGLQAATIVNFLANQNIYVSTGTACNKKGDNILKTLGHPKKIYESAVRISFSHQNTVKEIEQTAQILTKTIKTLLINAQSHHVE